MRWHYILGTVFGVFVLTWSFSGMLSMEPFAWSDARGLRVDEGVYQEGLLELESFPAFDASQWQSLAQGNEWSAISRKWNFAGLVGRLIILLLQ